MGSYICRVAAKCGFIPVSISPNCCPPVYGEINEHENSWITKVSRNHHCLMERFTGEKAMPSNQQRGILTLWRPVVQYEYGLESDVKAMIYTTKPSYPSSKLLWECNYEGALQSIEMARVWILFSI